MGSSAPRLRKAIVAAAIVLGLLAVACWPVTTASGYNYRVTTRRLTLLEKTIWFVDRDLQMRRLTREIAGTDGTPQQRLMRMYNWVADNIRPVPPGMPVVDDHVSYIFVRHYGADDQRAEALAALASYDGMPATTVGLAKAAKMHGVQLTIVRLGDRLVVFDVNHRIVFRTPSGALADFEQLKRDPSLVRNAAPNVVVDDVPYWEHLEKIGQVTPSFRRMQEQRFWPRLKDEVAERLPRE